MKIIEYFKSENQAYWLEEIGKSDWSAGTLLYRHLKSGDFKTVCGDTAEVLLLCKGRELISFCIYAERDDNGISDPSMTPWAGFVYTFPEHRGKRRIGKLLEYVYALAKKDGHKRVYISTSDTGLYEKYACSFLKMMKIAKGGEERVYVMNISDQNYTDVFGKVVSGTVDRPSGTVHPDYPDMIYPVNYGFVDGVFAKDGKEQDVYILGADHPLKSFTGRVAAVWHRLNDIEDKWIVSVNGKNLTPEEIVEAIAFQEQYFMGELYLPQTEGGSF